MRIYTGQGLYAIVWKHSIASITNYRRANTEQPLKSMCEVTTVAGDKFVCDMEAEKLAGLLDEEAKGWRI